MSVRSSFWGTWRVARVWLRALWPAQLGAVLLGVGVVLAVASSIEALYPTAELRQQYSSSIASSGIQIIFNGRGYDTTTLGGITAFEVGIIGQIVFPLIGVMLAIFLTRRQEQAGRIELLTACRAGMAAPLGASAILVLANALVMHVLMTAGLSVVGIPTGGAAWYAAGLAGCTVFFGGIGFVLGQLFESARTAYMTGAGAATVAFLLRAVVDAASVNEPWISPLGWLPETRPYGDRLVWPFIAYALGALILVAIASVIALRRDLGAGAFETRRGPASARPSLATAGGVAWNQCRSAILGWAILATGWAFAFGVFSEDVTSVMDANPNVVQAMGAKRASDIVVLLVSVVGACGAAAVGVQSATRLAGEETSGRLGAILSTRVTRMRLWGTWWVMNALGAVAVLMVSSLMLGVSLWVVGGERAAFGSALGVGLGYVAPIVFIAALCSLFAALGPRWTGLGWVVVGWCLIVGFLAEALRLPEWARDLSPLHVVGLLPIDDPSLAGIVGLFAAAVAAGGLATVVFRARDLRAG